MADNGIGSECRMSDDRMYSWYMSFLRFVGDEVRLWCCGLVRVVDT